MLGARIISNCFSYGVTTGAEAFATSFASGVEGMVVSVHDCTIGDESLKAAVDEAHRRSRRGRSIWVLQRRWPRTGWV